MPFPSVTNLFPLLFLSQTLPARALPSAKATEKEPGYFRYRADGEADYPEWASLEEGYSQELVLKFKKVSRLRSAFLLPNSALELLHFLARLALLHLLTFLLFSFLFPFSFFLCFWFSAASTGLLADKVSQKPARGLQRYPAKCVLLGALFRQAEHRALGERDTLTETHTSADQKGKPRRVLVN